MILVVNDITYWLRRILEVNENSCWFITVLKVNSSIYWLRRILEVGLNDSIYWLERIHTL
jgi:hypothetical protein